MKWRMNMMETSSVLTEKKIILENISFNQACHWLDKEMPKGTFTGCCKGNSPFITIQYKDRMFWYDETRSMLLGK